MNTEIIFIINSPYPNYAGGIENWLFNLSRLLSNEYTITIISIDNDEYPLLYERNKKIRYIRVKTISSFRLLRPLVRSYIGLLDIMLASAMMGYVIRRQFKAENSYYVVCLDTMYCVKAGINFKKKNKLVKLISSARCPHAEMYTSRYGLLKNYFFALEKRATSLVDEVWANGLDTADQLLKKGIPSSIMLNGVDYQNVKNNPPIEGHSELFDKYFSIINVSTLLPIKGIYELIDALSHIINELKIKMHLIFIGKGDSEVFKRYAKEKSINEYVFFLGHKSNPVQYIKAAKVSTCLSGGSGMSMAAIESMAAGVPIIAWDSPVYRQFNMNSTNMKLVEENNYLALASGILDMHSKYPEYKQIAERAELYAEQFDWNNVKDLFVKKLFQ